MKKMIAWLCLALCSLLPLTACAQPQLDTVSSLTLRLTEGGKGLPGASFEIFRVADMNSDAQFVLLEGLDIGNVNINKVEGADAWASLAETLLGQVQSADAAAVTDDQGLAKMGGLKTGLYLVKGKPVEIGSWAYDFTPFMVSMPGKDGETWIYDVQADVKHTREPLTCDIKIVKVWKDEGYSKVRPMRILADLYCDGELAYTVELSADNNWTYEFKDLESAHDWTVKEQVIPAGYEVAYSTKGGALVITNTLTAPPTAAPDIPQTGLTWWPVPVMAILGITLVIIGWAMHRKWRNEHDQA